MLLLLFLSIKCCLLLTSLPSFLPYSFCNSHLFLFSFNSLFNLLLFADPFLITSNLISLIIALLYPSLPPPSSSHISLLYVPLIPNKFSNPFLLFPLTFFNPTNFNSSVPPPPPPLLLPTYLSPFFPPYISLFHLTSQRFFALSFL